MKTFTSYAIDVKFGAHYSSRQTIVTFQIVVNFAIKFVKKLKNCIRISILYYLPLKTIRYHYNMIVYVRK